MAHSTPDGSPASASSAQWSGSAPPLLAYGVEAPYVPALMIVGAVGLVILGAVKSDLFPILVGIVVLAQGALFLYVTTRGKHRVWAELLDGANLAGDESVLDIGCGRGAVTIAVADRLPRGTAVGIDLWRSKDQSGNSADVAVRNARAAGVGDRVRFDTGDMTALPYEDGAFDVVTSALAVHNIKKPEGRRAAVEEALRVLRPGGRLLLVDIRNIEEYRKIVAGQRDVTVSKLGPRYWYGGPWMAASALQATKI